MKAIVCLFAVLGLAAAFVSTDSQSGFILGNWTVVDSHPDSSDADLVECCVPTGVVSMTQVTDNKGNNLTQVSANWIGGSCDNTVAQPFNLTLDPTLSFQAIKNLTTPVTYNKITFNFAATSFNVTDFNNGSNFNFVNLTLPFTGGEQNCLVTLSNGAGIFKVIGAVFVGLAALLAF